MAVRLTAVLKLIALAVRAMLDQAPQRASIRPSQLCPAQPKTTVPTTMEAVALLPLARTACILTLARVYASQRQTVQVTSGL